MKSRTAFMLNADRLGSDSSEDHFAEFVDRVKAHPQSGGKPLVTLLREQHLLYAGRSANSVNRMKGYAMAAFKETGLPASALPFVLETLESGFHPYLVAGAARALQGLKNPHPQIATYLVKAIYNVWQADKPVSFDSYRISWPLEQFSTAVDELLNTLRSMRGRASMVLTELELLRSDFGNQFDSGVRKKLEATISEIRGDSNERIEDCCHFPVFSNRSQEPRDVLSLNPLLEDQDGKNYEWKEYFQGKHCVLAFFYTRCSNPRKCTLTIQTMVAIQTAIIEKGLSEKIKTAAITYDPKYDTKAALKAYGEARRFGFSDDNKMFRCCRGFENVLECLDLGVNFRDNTVNHHRIEFFLLDPSGNVIRSFLRFKVSSDQVIDAIVEDVENIEFPIKRTDNKKAGNDNWVSGRIGAGWLSNLFSIVLPVLIAIFPKCPLCWASYMSLLGIAGFGSIPYSPWLLPVIVFFVSINLVVMYRNIRLRNGPLPFVFCCIGTICLLSIWIRHSSLLVVVGLACLICGVVLNSLSYQKLNRFKLKILKLTFKNGFLARHF